MMRIIASFLLVSCSNQDAAFEVKVGHDSRQQLLSRLSSDDQVAIETLIAATTANDTEAVYTAFRSLSLTKQQFSDPNCANPDLALVNLNQVVRDCAGEKVVGFLTECSDDGQVSCLPKDTQIVVDREAVREQIWSGSVFLDTVGTATAGIDPWDIRYGEVVGGVVGLLKTDCRNMADLAVYNNSFGVAEVGMDIYDSIDDRGSGDLRPQGYIWSNIQQHLCGFDPLLIDYPNWEFVPTDGAATGSSAVFIDRFSKLLWTRGSNLGDFAWDDTAGGGVGTGALEYCEGLVHGGRSDWRLPTQKELLNAYVNGIVAVGSENLSGNNLGSSLDRFYSSTTASSNGRAIAGTLVYGFFPDTPKSQVHKALCIAEAD